MTDTHPEGARYLLCLRGALQAGGRDHRRAAIKADPLYGGPEYETLGTFGSYCGVRDLAAVS